MHLAAHMHKKKPVYPGKSFFFFLNALKVSTHAKLCCCQAAVCHPRPKSTFCFKLSQEFPRLYSVTKLKVDKSVLSGRIVVGLDHFIVLWDNTASKMLSQEKFASPFELIAMLLSNIERKSYLEISTHIE